MKKQPTMKESIAAAHLVVLIELIFVRNVGALPIPESLMAETAVDAVDAIVDVMEERRSFSHSMN